MGAIVRAHITGTVWKIDVRVGDAIVEGQVCVILESMKMELPVVAPLGGTVDRIYVVEGQSVNDGDPLLSLSG